MEVVTTFLESSTIHGLTYISTTRKYVRLFWILVIITGFIGAGYLINESFDAWSESPIKTSIETLPIEEIKLPKVTVCPPKNTFTDLNYDFMMTKNITLTKEMRDEMFKYSVDVINEDSFSENNWTKLHEGDRFFNWYHGYTKIDKPYSDEVEGLTYDISTTATSGVITTQYYGEKIMPDQVERKLHYGIDVYPPLSVLENENVTMHFKMEKASMLGLTSGNFDFLMMSGIKLGEDDNQTILYTNFTPPKGPSDYFTYKYCRLIRDVSFKDVETQELEVMPGFRLSWWYTAAPGIEITPDASFKNDKEINEHFVR